MVIERAAVSAITSSRGTHPRRSIKHPWPEMTPPEGSMSEVRTPLARVTGMCSLSGCSAIELFSSGWNWAASA